MDRCHLTNQDIPICPAELYSRGSLGAERPLEVSIKIGVWEQQTKDACAVTAAVVDTDGPWLPQG